MMLEWVWRISEQVQQLANMDPEYQELARQRDQLDEAFSALLERLSTEDRELLLEYMDVDGNLHYRFSQLAWRYGTLHR